MFSAEPARQTCIRSSTILPLQKISAMPRNTCWISLSRRSGPTSKPELRLLSARARLQRHPWADTFFREYFYYCRSLARRSHSTYETMNAPRHTSTQLSDIWQEWDSCDHLHNALTGSPCIKPSMFKIGSLNTVEYFMKTTRYWTLGFREYWHLIIFNRSCSTFICKFEFSYNYFSISCKLLVQKWLCILEAVISLIILPLSARTPNWLLYMST